MYPSTLETSFTNPMPSDQRLGHAQLHRDINAVVIALQAKLGIDGSLDNTSLDFLLKSSLNPGHTHSKDKVGLGNVADALQLIASNNLSDLTNVSIALMNLGIDLNLFLTKIVGEITIYSGAIAPVGTLICDGSAISRATYSDLFSVIGTTYGAGNGSTTFNIPNLKGRVVVGFNSSETEFNSLGRIGGEKEHTLTTNEIPSHNHTSSFWNSSGGVGLYINHSNNANTAAPMTVMTTSSVGSDTSHNNIQPYITLNYIIKY